MTSRPRQATSQSPGRTGTDASGAMRVIRPFSTTIASPPRTRPSARKMLQFLRRSLPSTGAEYKRPTPETQFLLAASGAGLPADFHAQWRGRIYPARMAKRFNPEAALPIELEMAKEKAFALRRTAYSIEKLLAEMQQIERELGALSGPERARKVEAHSELRAQVEHERWKMIVQREALGLHRHDDVDLFYPLPARLRG